MEYSGLNGMATSTFMMTAKNLALTHKYLAGHNDFQMETFDNYNITIIKSSIYLDLISKSTWFQWLYFC